MTVWSALAQEQAGVLTRRQVLALGMTRAQINWQLTSGRWRQLDRGVYLAHCGPMSEMTAVWTAVLRAGPGAVAGPACTLWLAGLLPKLPAVADVCVPPGRHPDIAGIDIIRRNHLARARHPTLDPPRLRLEEAVLDAAARLTRPEHVIDLVLRVTQRRLSTADRLAARLATRRAHPWRALLRDILADVVDGVQSPLERHYKHKVERPHGLPAAARNSPEQVAGSRRYRDVRYPRFRLVIELDGREAHPDGERFRDRDRDNRVVLQGETSLRYGWREIVGDPCGVAAQAAVLLRRGGWTGRLRPCGPHCPAVRAA